jgi:hypothetical protein
MACSGSVFPKIVARVLRWFQKLASNPHIFVHVNTECPDDRYPKLGINISELILDSYEYTYY